MQDAMNPPMVNLVASLSSNSPLSKARRRQLAIMTTSFIQEQINMGWNDLMLELSKQLANIVKPIVHNKIQVTQQQANTKDDSTLATPWENMVNKNASAN